MTISVNAKELANAISQITSLIETRNTLPILSHAALSASGDGVLLIRGTDLQRSAAIRIPCALGEFSACLPVSVLAGAANRFPANENIVISMPERGVAEVTCRRSKLSICTLPIEDFPVAEAVKNEDLLYRIELSPADLSQFLKPAFAISTEETRYYLNGIYLHWATNRFEGDREGAPTVAATDGHRLCALTFSHKGAMSVHTRVIIPAKTIREMMRMMKVRENIYISGDGSRIEITQGNYTLVSRLIDGDFPAYGRAIPENNEHLLRFKKDDLLNALAVCSVIAGNKSPAAKICLHEGEGCAQITHAHEANIASEVIDVEWSGPSMEIGYNIKYLQEMVSKFEGQTVEARLGRAGDPGLFRDVDGDVSAVFVIMPMRV